MLAEQIAGRDDSGRKLKGALPPSPEAEEIQACTAACVLPLPLPLCVTIFCSSPPYPLPSPLWSPSCSWVFFLKALAQSAFSASRLSASCPSGLPNPLFAKAFAQVPLSTDADTCPLPGFPHLSPGPMCEDNLSSDVLTQTLSTCLFILETGSGTGLELS